MRLRQFVNGFSVGILMLLFAVNVQAQQFDGVNYKGAFGSTNWAHGWTALDSYGVLAPATEGSNVVEVTDSDISAGSNVYWTADNIYILNGRVFVDEGAVREYRRAKHRK